MNGLTPDNQKPSDRIDTFPPGLHYAYWFSVFNAFSYQVVLSSPMVLYARSLGASATTLGIVAGMMPLLVIFQIPAANHIPRLGFRRFVFAGWGIRVLFIFAIALIPITSSVLDASNRLGMLLVLLFGFNLSRGISSCAWLPWITALVPANLRGKYLARDAAVQNLASLLTFLVAAAVLAGSPTPIHFSALFLFSAITGAISLSFLKRMPDAEVPEEIRTSKAQVPWLAMIRFPAFSRLLVTVFAWSVAYGGIAAFTVAFMKNALTMNEGTILMVTSVSFLGGLCSLWFLGSRLDHLGSKPVLTFCFCAWTALLVGWAAISGGALNSSLVVLVVLEFLMGLFAAIVQMANTRLAMAIVPVMGRNHFFALYSVIGNVTLGLAPIAWGILIDLVGSKSGLFLGLAWTRYTVFFAGAAITFLAAGIFSRKLVEPQAVSMETLLRDILIQSPMRMWLRLWPR